MTSIVNTLEAEVARVRTIRVWGDGKRIKVAPGKWVRYKVGSDVLHGVVQGDKKARARAVDEKANLKSEAARLRADYEAGNLDKSLTFGGHIKLAKEHIRLHDASLNGTLKSLKALMPDGMSKSVKCYFCKDPPGVYERVNGRVKTLSSILGKLVRKHHRMFTDGPNKGKYDLSRPHLNRADKLKDITGSRIILDSSQQVHEVVKNFKAKYGKDIVSEEDMVSNPRGDGYRSYHAEFKDPADGLVKEVQIRTPRQQTWADWSHELYKPAKKEHRAWADSATTEIKQAVHKYAVAISDHYAKLDAGEKVGDAPECPDVVKNSPLGCLP